MEKGKLYKSMYNGVVVFCTAILGDKRFSGIVVDSGNSTCDIGYINNRFIQNSFKEYAPAQTLAKGQIYDVPKGYKATIKNSQVLIESNVKYYKHELEESVIYSRHVSGDKTTIITLYCNGDTELVLLAEMSSADISDCGKEIDEDVFVDAYKRALKNLEL